MRIGRFQKKRSARNEATLRKCLDKIGPALRQFRDIVQSPKRAYFDAITRRDLNISDRIIALDTAVGSMHIEFSVPRMYMHRESEDLKSALESCRQTDEEPEAQERGRHPDDLLCRGLPASPGYAVGEVFLWDESISFARIPAGCILVSRMTRPEIAPHMNRILAIVTDIGGRLCHAAIIALEKGVPCVVGTGDATQVLQPGMTVSVDGDSGYVCDVPECRFR
jgi:phosphoenolpyruvate synthase/pyruvate phosphate dikinase